jgi:hypothetical protein
VEDYDRKEFQDFFAMLCHLCPGVVASSSSKITRSALKQLFRQHKIPIHDAVIERLFALMCANAHRLVDAAGTVALRFLFMPFHLDSILFRSLVSFVRLLDHDGGFDSRIIRG